MQRRRLLWLRLLQSGERTRTPRSGSLSAAATKSCGP